MMKDKQLRFWLLGLVILIALLIVLRGILLPFVLGMAIAYFLDPVADRLEAMKVPRWLATTIVLLVFTLLGLITLILVAPVFTTQLTELIAKTPAFVDMLRVKLDGLLALVQTKADPALLAKIREAINGASGEVLSVMAEAVGGLITQGAAIANFLSLIVITPVVAFYLLRDWDVMIAKIDAWLPRRHKAVIERLSGEVNQTLAGFVRGQSMVCLILGIFYAVGLTLAGLDFGLVIGMIAGILTFIPYAGSIFGLLMSVGLATLQFDSWINVGIVAIIFFIGQALEGNVLTPKLVGEKVGLHPVWVIFALFAFGALFGFVGVLIAVPVAAVIGVAVRFGLELYLGSRYFDDSGELSEEHAPSEENAP